MSLRDLLVLLDRGLARSLPIWTGDARFDPRRRRHRIRPPPDQPDGRATIGLMHFPSSWPAAASSRAGDRLDRQDAASVASRHPPADFAATTYVLGIDPQWLHAGGPSVNCNGGHPVHELL
jgi:hypothetical protein